VAAVSDRAAGYILSLLYRLGQLRTWSAACQEIGRHPELLNDDADDVLEVMASTIDDGSVAPGSDDDIVRGVQRYLRRIRRVGLDTAYAEEMGALPAWLEPLSERISELAGDGDVVTAPLMDTLRTIIAHPQFAELRPALRAQVIGRLGAALARQSDAEPDDDQLDEALTAVTAALKLVSIGSPVGVELLDRTLMVLIIRYERTGTATDLESALSVMNRGGGQDPDESNDRGHNLARIGSTLLQRFVEEEREKSLIAALTVLQKAVDAAEGTDVAERLGELGAATLSHYEVTGSADQLTASIELLQRARELGRSDEAHLSNLGNALLTRYEHGGERADLDEAVTMLELSTAAGVDTPAQAGLLSNFGNGLWRRYERTGDLGDLDRAVDLLKRAVALAGPRSPRAPSMLTNLGIYLRRRFERTGGVEDLNAAITALSDAANLVNPRSVKVFSPVLNLGTAMMRRYAHTGSLADLEASVELFQRAADIAPPGSPAMPIILADLGLALTMFPEEDGDIDVAITVLEHAVALTPQDSSDYPRHVLALGAGYMQRAGLHDQAPADIDRAVACFRTAVDATPVDSPDLPRRLSNLSNGLQSMANADLDDPERTALYRRTCELGLDADVHTTLATVHRWGAWAAHRLAWPEAAAAYRFGVSAMHRLVRVQLVRQNKEDSLLDAVGITDSAAYAMAKAVALEEAVTAIEQGRAVLLSDALQRDRADLKQLQDGPTRALADRYRDCAARVHDLEAAVLPVG
jgi:tetratricopeptide (TPR) repeat protein